MNAITPLSRATLRPHSELHPAVQATSCDQVVLSGQSVSSKEPVHFERQVSDFLTGVADHVRDQAHLLERAGVKLDQQVHRDEMFREERRFYHSEAATVILINSSSKVADGYEIHSTVGKLIAPLDHHPNLQSYVQALIKEDPQRRFFAHCEQRFGLTGVFELVGSAVCKTGGPT